jgi:hypothetical protein
VSDGKIKTVSNFAVRRHTPYGQAILYYWAAPVSCRAGSDKNVKTVQMPLKAGQKKEEPRSKCKNFNAKAEKIWAG